MCINEFTFSVEKFCDTEINTKREQCFQCPFCTGCPDCIDFQKVAELKNAGLVIYRHSSRKHYDESKASNAPASFNAAQSRITTNDPRTDGDKDDVYILQNIKDTEITSSDFMPEFERKKVSCPRCRHIMARAQVLLENVSNIGKKDIRGVCYLCRAKQSNKTCPVCDKVVKKFAKMRSNEQEEKMKKRFQIFLGKMQKLLKATLEPEKQKVEIKRSFSDIKIDSLIERSHQSVHRLPEVDHLLFQPERPRTVPVSDVRGSYLDDDDVASIIANKFKVKIKEKHMDNVPEKKYSFSSINLQDTREIDISLDMPKELTSEIILTETGIKTGKYTDSDKQKIKSSFTKRKEEVKKHQLIRKYNSLDSLITSFSAITEDVLKKQLKYFFPQTKRNQEKNIISSMELISKTHDRLVMEADEKKKKEEELRQKKIDEENRKRQARDDKRRTVLSKKKRKGELESETELSSDESHPVDKMTGKRMKRTRPQASGLSSEEEVFDDETKHKRPKKAFDEDEGKMANKRKKEKHELDRNKVKGEGDKDRLKKSDVSKTTSDKQRGESRTKDGKEKVKGEKVGSEKLEKPIKTNENKDNTSRKQAKDLSGKDKDKKEAKHRSDKDNKPSKDTTGKSGDGKQAKDKPEKSDDEKREKELVSKLQDKKPRKDQADKFKDEIKGKGQEIKSNQTKERAEHVSTSGGKDSANKVGERAPKTSKESQMPNDTANSKDQTSRPTDAKSIKNETSKSREKSAKTRDSKQLKDLPSKDISNKEKDVALEKEERQVPKGDLSRKGSLMSTQRKQKGDQEAAEVGKSHKTPTEKVRIQGDKEGKGEKGALGLQNKEQKNKSKDEKIEKTGIKGSPTQMESKEKSEKEKSSKGVTPEVDVKNIKTLKSQGDLILTLVKVKRDDNVARPVAPPVIPPAIPIKTIRTARKKKIASPSSILSDLELDLDSLINQKTQIDDDVDEIIIGTEICHKKAVHAKPPPEILPALFKVAFTEPSALPSIPTELKEEGEDLTAKKLDDLPKGVIRYTLSDRSFIEKGWTMLPTEKVVRKMNVYRMRPSHPEFDWFEHNKRKGYMNYDTGEKLAEFDNNGRGRWYYRNGKLALDYYDCEESNAQQRFTLYSSGRPDERGRSRPTTVLAMFDYSGNGVVFDHNGKIRLKYNQTEGVLLDREIGPVSHWKWHSLNDPPVLQQVMIDTHMAYKDPNIIDLGGPGDEKTRPDDEDMLAVEFDNFVKEKNKKSTQKFKPFQIKMKALKINENFSLRILDQATIYLLFRDGQTNLKLNLGMVLDNQEIVDTDTAELGEVSNNIERLPAVTDSIKELQKFVGNAKRFDRLRTERNQRYYPTVPAVSIDKLNAPLSQPLRRPLTTVSSTVSENPIKQSENNKRRKPPGNVLYYANRLI